MKILSHYHESVDSSSVALTIGNFDGVHLGHRAVIEQLKKTGLTSAIMTFTNHPSEVLDHSSVTRLTTLSHRLSLFEAMGVDRVILIPFTKDFSQQSAKMFLTDLKRALPFTHLILGHDSMIGHDRNRNLLSLSHELSFTLNYLEPISLNGKIISSSLIRKHILAGELSEASQLLGRPYSIQATVQSGAGIGRQLGFHTANLPVDELALPPLGVYAVEVILNHEPLLAVANLGYAPTLHQNRSISLEIHILDRECNLYDQEIEVHFIQYLRPEKKFSSPTELKIQIQADIAHCRSINDILLKPNCKLAFRDIS